MCILTFLELFASISEINKKVTNEYMPFYVCVRISDKCLIAGCDIIVLRR